MSPAKTRRKIFLLSPAHAAGERARLVFSESARFELALRLRQSGAPLGEIFAFISGLYFRGKLAYANAFASPPKGIPGSFVITPGAGLIPPDMVMTLQQLRTISAVPVNPADPRYAAPLTRDLEILAELSGPRCAYVLLGSIATSKYLEPLLSILGKRLLIPHDFIGRGDMSRGGLMLRCARTRVELSYVPAEGISRQGRRLPA